LIGYFALKSVFGSASNGCVFWFRLQQIVNLQSDAYTFGSKNVAQGTQFLAV